MLLHAESRWPKTIIHNMWPYALKMANSNRNDLPQPKYGVSPHEKFSSIMIKNNDSHKHVFGCPVYALDNTLQAGNSISKWKSRERLGIYLGKAFVHERTVALVLNPSTGLVSPQFHIRFDDVFTTTNNKSGKRQLRFIFIAGLGRF